MVKLRIIIEMSVDFLERGYCRKTSPAYVQACCVLRGVAATNVGIGLYLDNFTGPEEEKVFLLFFPWVDVDCCQRSHTW